jgi:hypothetical protein
MEKRRDVGRVARKAVYSPGVFSSWKMHPRKGF